ncbi:hypothetical protein M7I_4753 [Glarea lozoyensis 74030]|uniref:Uncharacterized protein n=1 Tax=Glarea lozoyensis (strain ATCC 74030 / MF5533) TaxID=1104152 RepID=H0EQ12_GLAL7|nr:hypothetical protein M7I_4753 [Glarea lozoyensis 74030]
MILSLINAQAIQTAYIQYHGHQAGITEHPDQHDVASECLVVAFFDVASAGFGFDFDLESGEFSECGCVKDVEVGVVESWLFCFFTGFGVDFGVGKGRWFVVAFGTPGYV